MGELTNFYNPTAVAIVGASKKPGKVGNSIVKNMIESGYPGKIYPVNPKDSEIEGLKAYPSVTAIPGPVELAVLSVPAAKVVEAARECGEKGIPYLVVITAGFKEIGKEGLDLEKELVATCRRYGMRMLGPNCVGMADTHTPINASFTRNSPLKGDIAFLSQSGATLIAILDWSRSVGLGFSKMVSLGNKGDLSEIEFIAEAAADPYTRVIACYLEDVADGARFLDVVREATRKKPVIILKSGTSQAGAQAASSHTGALAGSDLAYDTAFRQCGVIRARSLTELFELAIAFSRCPVPAGKRVAIVTNSGGPGIVATDNVEARGLTMARFTRETIDELRAGLPAEAALYNPVDVLGDGKADRYRFAMEKVLADPNVDSMVVLMCPTAVAQPVETTRAVVELQKQYPGKPILGGYLGGESMAEAVQLMAEAGIPCFTFPEPAIAAISGLVNYGQFREMPGDGNELSYPDVDKRAVKAIFYDVIRDNRLVLLGSEAAAVARAYGISAAPVSLATTPDEAVEEAQKMGYPVVLKVASPKILHKTDVGGVKVGLDSPEAVRRAFVEIMENVNLLLPEAVVYGIEVQKMMPKGTELIIGMTRDVQFGPMIACGLGGIYVNLLKDVSFRLARGLTRREIENMLAETKAYTLLRGYRGEKPADLPALVDAIGRTARLVLDFPEINEIDINPVFAYNQGLSALDIKITIS
ncbi:CoA-binding protein [Desulfofundulus thermobenzoicus]|uniref:CoA-binding protein n=1 Tax=Desulfofundulus thermobenzoicus TaxID=29376 RepID=A0A6N7IP32_9FIRM|nr:acetate--CoA ligase [Desulfofundulus thermobenzoicus]MQL51744.1 CoA-binding protein [Desulfofundulus thermobenzoicus]